MLRVRTAKMVLALRFLQPTLGHCLVPNDRDTVRNEVDLLCSSKVFQEERAKRLFAGVAVSEETKGKTFGIGPGTFQLTMEIITRCRCITNSPLPLHRI